MSKVGEDKIAHKQLSCSGFPKAYAHLSAVKSIGATRISLARSLVTLGPSHRSHHLTGSFWGSLRAVANVYSLLSAQLRPTAGFASLTASYRKADAFMLAEALTHWFAQKHLGARIVVPLEAHSGSLVRAGPAAPYPKQMPKYFRTAVKAGPKSEPDFLAFRGPGEAHIVESKGRAGFDTNGVTDKDINAARNKALRQVCKIATINGVAPQTRTACVFAFDQSGLVGQVTDPPETQTFDYRAETAQLVRQAYASVLDPLFQASSRDIEGGYVGIEFMPGWRFGIHKDVLKRLLSVEDEASATAFLRFVAEFSYEEEGTDSRSVGPDGLILTGHSDFPRRSGFQTLG